MKVRCTTNEFNFFTKDKTYDVMREASGYYVVEDDEGDLLALFQTECEVIDESN